MFIAPRFVFEFGSSVRSEISLLYQIALLKDLSVPKIWCFYKHLAPNGAFYHYHCGLVVSGFAPISFTS